MTLLIIELNDLKSNPAKLKLKIFEFYSADFEQNGSLNDYIQRYTRQDISNKQGIQFKDYDWRLNQEKIDKILSIYSFI